MVAGSSRVALEWHGYVGCGVHAFASMLLRTHLCVPHTPTWLVHSSVGCWYYMFSV
jgi:hypothetical protein